MSDHHPAVSTESQDCVKLLQYRYKWRLVMNSSCKTRSKQGCAQPSYALINHTGPFARPPLRETSNRDCIYPLWPLSLWPVLMLWKASQTTKSLNLKRKVQIRRCPKSDTKIIGTPNAEIKNGAIDYSCLQKRLCAVMCSAHWSYINWRASAVGWERSEAEREIDSGEVGRREGARGKGPDLQPRWCPLFFPIAQQSKRINLQAVLSIISPAGLPSAWKTMTTYCNKHEYCCGAYVDCRTGVTEVANCNHPRMQQGVGHIHSTLTRTPRQLVQQPQFHHHFHHHLHQQQPPPPHLSQPTLLNFQQIPLDSRRVPQYSSCTLPASTKSRGKFTNLRDSVKKSPTKSTAKVRASSSALWLANSLGTFSLEKVCGTESY